MSTVDDLVTWRGLPRDVRAAIAKGAKSGLIPQTPELRRVAYAGATANRWERPGRSVLIGAALLQTAIAAAVTILAQHRRVVLILVVVGIASFFATLITAPLLMQGRTWPQLAAAVAMGILFDTPPSSPAPLVASQPRLREAWVNAALLVWLFSAHAWMMLRLFNHRDFLITWSALTAWIAVLSASAEWRTGNRALAGSRRKPVLRFDGDGVSAPRLGVRIPWQDIAYVRVTVSRNRGRKEPAIELRAKNPAAVLAGAQPPNWRSRRQLTWLLGIEGGLVVPASWLDRPLLTVLIAARDYLAAEQSASV